MIIDDIRINNEEELPEEIIKFCRENIKWLKSRIEDKNKIIEERKAFIKCEEKQIEDYCKEMQVLQDLLKRFGIEYEEENVDN